MNAITLVVVNDGYGDQCGYSYQHRLQVARSPSRSKREQHYASMVWNTCNWLDAREYSDQSVARRSEAVEELEAYYAQQLAEM